MICVGPCLGVTVPWRTHHDYLSWSKKLRSEPVTGSQNAVNVLLGRCRFLVVDHRLVHRWVETLALRANALDSSPAEVFQETLAGKEHAFRPRPYGVILRRHDEGSRVWLVREILRRLRMTLLA
jgi:hypothetical protein